MEVKKIVEGMTAPQVAQVIDDNFKAQNAILEEDIAKQNNVIGVSEYKDFSEAEAVNVGDVRKYDGLLYECVEATTGAFDASKWKKSSFKNETEKKLSELGSKIEVFSILENGEVKTLDAQVIGRVGQTSTITTASTQRSIVYQVKKGDVYKANIAQYTDTSAISFSDTLPVIGGSALILKVGAPYVNGKVQEQEIKATAPSDGYIIITYIKDKQSKPNVYKGTVINEYATKEFENAFTRIGNIEDSILKKLQVAEGGNGYIDVNGNIVQVETYAYTAPLFVKKGTTISAKLECWSDQCAVASKKNLSDSVLTVLSLGKKISTSETLATYEIITSEDCYLYFSYAKKSGITVNELLVASRSDVNILNGKVENIEPNTDRIILTDTYKRKNTTYVVVDRKLVKGNRYQLIPSQNSWNSGTSSDIAFEVYTIKEENGERHVLKTFCGPTATADNIPSTIDIDVPSDDGIYYLGIYLNTTEPSKLYFELQNITMSEKGVYAEEAVKKYVVEKITEVEDVFGGCFISNQGVIVTNIPSYNVSKPISLKKGDIIKASFECWNDQCAIGLLSPVGRYEVLSLGKKKDSSDTIAEYNIIMPKDGQVSFSYAVASGITLDITTSKIPNIEKVDTTYSILDIEKINYNGNDFEYMDGFFIYKDTTLRAAATCFISKPLLFEKGDFISVGVECWGDMATIARTDEEGSVIEIISLGGGADHKEGSKDYYVYSHNVTKKGYYVVSGIKGESVYYEWERTASKTIESLNDKINNVVNNKPTSDLLPICQFVGLKEEAANGKENWTGQQVIDNIYEPLRQQYPSYIKRKSIGKSGGFDIWLYEFNNTTDEWFALANSKTLTEGIYLPSTNNLSEKEVAISKTTFEEVFAFDYANLYPLSTFSVRKPTLATISERVVNDESCVVLSCEDVIKVTDSSVTIYWTTKVKTYDQHCFILSGTHADENGGYLGTALALKYMVEHHSENPIMDYIFNNVKLSVVPILNMWGANQTPKVRTAQDGSQMNTWKPSELNVEQQAVADYISNIKDELSFYFDCHTAEWWSNYGYVYAIVSPHQSIMSAIVSAANYLCKHWFPNEIPLNWNVGQSSSSTTSSHYMMKEFGVESATVEFTGQDLMALSPCSRWDDKYMTYAVENFLNFILAAISARIKSNGNNIISNKFFEHTTMS